ncbi:MAG TPA: hypothetical protein EYN91_04500 [Candidatus Melainabacteria bacterium]|nr:hypothetical protein [Candidatus Melainabacteria bacterium]
MRQLHESKTMIKLTINNVPTLFIKAFTPEDVETIIGFVRDAFKSTHPAATRFYLSTRRLPMRLLRRWNV